MYLIRADSYPLSDKEGMSAFLRYQIKGMSALCKVSDKGYVCSL